jgi:hypothetical protein
MDSWAWHSHSIRSNFFNRKNCNLIDFDVWHYVYYYIDTEWCWIYMILWNELTNT